MFLILSNQTYAGGFKIDPIKGEIIEYLYGSPSKINTVSGITEHKGKIYLCSLVNNVIAVINS